MKKATIKGVFLEKPLSVLLDIDGVEYCAMLYEMRGRWLVKYAGIKSAKDGSCVSDYTYTLIQEEVDRKLNHLNDYQQAIYEAYQYVSENIGDKEPFSPEEKLIVMAKSRLSSVVSYNAWCRARVALKLRIELPEVTTQRQADYILRKRNRHRTGNRSACTQETQTSTPTHQPSQESDRDVP